MAILQKKYTCHSLPVFRIILHQIMFDALKRQSMVLNKHRVLGILPLNKLYWNSVLSIPSLILHYLYMLLHQLLLIFWCMLTT